MSEYSQGICQDGAAILCDGQPLTIEEILERLNALEGLKDRKLPDCITSDSCFPCDAYKELWETVQLYKKAMFTLSYARIDWPINVSDEDEEMVSNLIKQAGSSR